MRRENLSRGVSIHSEDESTLNGGESGNEDCGSFSDAGLEGLEHLSGVMILRIFEYLDWRSLLIFCVYFDASLTLETREAMAQGLTSLRLRMASEIEDQEEQFLESIEELEVIREVCKATAAKLTRVSLSELKTLRQAPLVCQNAMSCVMVLLDGETRDLSWRHALNMLSTPNFLARLKSFDSKALVTNPALMDTLQDLLKYLPSTAVGDADGATESSLPLTPAESTLSRSPSVLSSPPKGQKWNTSVKLLNLPTSSSPNRRFSGNMAIEQAGHILARWVKETWLCLVTEAEILETRPSLRANLARLHGISVAIYYVTSRLDEETSRAEAFSICLTPFESCVEKCHGKIQRDKKKRGIGIPSEGDLDIPVPAASADTDASAASTNTEDATFGTVMTSTQLSPIPWPTALPLASTSPESMMAHCTIPSAGMIFWTHEFYETQCPDKLESVHDVCIGWAGQEALLMASLRSKYMAQNMGAARSVSRPPRCGVQISPQLMQIFVHHASPVQILNGLNRNRRLWGDFVISERPPIGASSVISVISRLLGHAFNPEIQRRKGTQRWAYALREVDGLLLSMVKFLRAAEERQVPAKNWLSARNLYDASTVAAGLDGGVASDAPHSTHYVRLVKDLELWVECAFLFRHAQSS